MAQPKFVPLSNLTLPYLREIDPRVATDLLQIMNTINRTGIPVPLEVAGTDDGGTTIIPLNVDASGHLNINIVSPVDASGNVLFDIAAATVIYQQQPTGLPQSGTVTVGVPGTEVGAVGWALGFEPSYTADTITSSTITYAVYDGPISPGSNIIASGTINNINDPVTGNPVPRFPYIFSMYLYNNYGGVLYIRYNITVVGGAWTATSFKLIGIAEPFPLAGSAISSAISVTQGTSPWVTKDQSDGTTGVAVPTIAGLAGGTDGTLLRGILVDTSGRIILGAPSANLPVTIAAQTLSPIVVSGSMTQGTSPWVVGGAAATGAVPVGNPVLVAGFDGTDVRDISTDTSGRIILGAPSANIPVSIAAQSLSPIIVRDSSDFTAGSAFGSGYMGIVGGIDNSGSARVLGMVGGPAVAVGAPNSLLVSAVDPGGLSRFLVVDRPGTASSVSAYPVSGTDGTNSRILSTDTSGRIILGAPSANLPVSIAAQSLSPIVTKDAADGTLGSAVPGSAAFVAGSDGTNLRALPVQAYGSANPANALMVLTGSDGTNTRPLYVLAPGSANPAYAQVVQAGTDGTLTRILSTNASGQLILPPATTSAAPAGSSGGISNASSHTFFGPVSTALNAKWWTLQFTLQTGTVVTATYLQIILQTASGIVIATTLIQVPLTASIPATGIVIPPMSGTFGDGGLTVPSNASGAFEVIWNWQTAPTAAAGYISATVGY